MDNVQKTNNGIITFGFITLSIFGVYNFLQAPATSSLLDPDILLSTLSLCASFCVRDQVSHPYSSNLFLIHKYFKVIYINYLV
jgi:hypothetical protein